MPELAASTPTTDLSGQHVLGYSLLRKIGAGGMAEVYLAEQESLGRRVAMKILHPRLASDPSYVQRFNNEARAAASLVHPNIVQIHEVGNTDGIHFIAQEFVAGKNLDQILQRQGALEPGTVLEILRQVTSALCRAAEIGIVHRDIKPGNILFGPEGTVKVADFGLARIQQVDSHTLTQVGVTMGTPLYMSPEQIEGRPVDARSDIYSLGVTAYHLLAGTPPHTGETALAIAMQHVNRDPDPLDERCPGLSLDFAALVHRMLAKDPAERFASPADLLKSLRDLSQQASQDGWAAGPDQWTLVDWIAADQSRTKAGAELMTILRQQTKLKPTRTSPSWRTLLIAAGIVGGLSVGWFLSPDFLLQPPTSDPIPRQDSPAAQLFHAKMTDSAKAWRAVEEYFPGEDAYYHRLAKQGLIRHDLFVEANYPEARRLAEELAAEAPQDEALQSFALAAQVVACEQMGQDRDAREAHSQITASMSTHLQRSERQLYDQMQGSLSRLSE